MPRCAPEGQPEGSRWRARNERCHRIERAGKSALEGRHRELANRAAPPGRNGNGASCPAAARFALTAGYPLAAPPGQVDFFTASEPAKRGEGSPADAREAFNAGGSFAVYAAQDDRLRRSLPRISSSATPCNSRTRAHAASAR